MDITLNDSSRKIVDYYPDKELFISEAIRVFDRLLTYFLDVNGFHSPEQITSNWKDLIKSCDQAIDSVIENTAEQGYCSWLGPDDS
ncbi:MAG: hypothetical protein ACTSW1_00440 [Candidatus Hodarchaeales archaeon]